MAVATALLAAGPGAIWGAAAELPAIDVDLNPKHLGADSEPAPEEPEVGGPTTPPRGPLWLDVTLVDSREEGHARLIANWHVLGPASDARLSVVLDDGARLVNGDGIQGPVPEGVGEAAMVVVVEEEGRHMVQLRLSGHLPDGPDEVIRTLYLAQNNAGEVVAVPSEDPGQVVGEAIELGEGVTELVSQGGDDNGVTADGHCYVSYTQIVQTSGDTAIPSSKRNVRTPFVEVHVVNEGGTTRATEVADANGVAEFTNVLQNPCGEKWEIQVHLRWFDGSTEKVRVGPRDKNTYWYQGGSLIQVSNGDTWTRTHSASFSPQAYLLGQAKESHDAADNAGHEPTRVRIHRTDGESHTCTACYSRGDPGDIYFDGTSGNVWNDRTIYHEYGHHAHYFVAGNFAGSSYGQHSGCSSSCHHWDSVHGTTGSAFKEAWANVYVGMVTGDSNRGFNLENPDNSRTDHTDLNCWGPHRECSVAAALWDQFELSATSLGDFLDVLATNPTDIHEFEEEWDSQGKSNGGSFDSYLRNVHIYMNGDAGSQGDAGNSFGSSVDGSSWRSGVLSYDPHQSSTDRNDYYHMWVAPGETITVTMTPPTGEDLDLYLYDRNGNQVDYSLAAGDAQETVDGTADWGNYGNWRFRVKQWSDSQGLYTWTVSVG